jgi:hypothetical protein
MCSLFAHAMLAYVEEPETCKEIISSNRLGVKGKYMLAMLPEKIYNVVVNDREFLMSIFTKYNGIGTRLPDHLRYDEQFVLMTIEHHNGDFFKSYDVDRILKMDRVVDAALHNNKTAVWMYSHLPESQKESVGLVAKMMNDDELTIEIRHKVYACVPDMVKLQKTIRTITTKLFGRYHYYGYTIADPVVAKLLDIAHDCHSSGGSTNTGNTRYLRSLLFDLQSTLMPEEVSNMMGSSWVPKAGKTYERILPECNFASENKIDVLSHRDLMDLMETIEDIIDATSSILEPRRRDGSYPECYYCEDFEGLRVRCFPNDDGEWEVTTLSGKPVNIPTSWREELDRLSPSGFFGKLHAGYGQLSKTTKLKNGTLGAYITDDDDETKAAAMAEWDGVVIKSYGYLDETGPVTINSFQGPNACPSFVEPVPVTYLESGQEGEKKMIDMHRAITNKGGVGIVFREHLHPDNLISLEGSGYSHYAKKIVDFLTVYPLQVLNAYVMAFETEGEDDGDEATAARFKKAATSVAKVVTLSRKRSAKSTRGNPKKKKARQVTPSSTAVVSTGASSSTDALPNSVAAPQAQPDYWDDDDDEEVSEVSGDEDVAEVESMDEEVDELPSDED